jgi:hypothetical protein
MCCPEWEDANFRTRPRDHFRPRWHLVRLYGFKRSQWFVQGPQWLCLKYLAARLENRAIGSRLLWYDFAAARLLLSYFNLLPEAASVRQFAGVLATRAKNLLARGVRPAVNVLRKLVGLCSRVVRPGYYLSLWALSYMRRKLFADRDQPSRISRREGARTTGCDATDGQCFCALSRPGRVPG